MTKREARAWARETARRLIPLREQHGLAIAQAVRSLPEYAAADTLCAFWPMEDEPDIRPLLSAVRRDGKTLCLPRCGEDGAMTMHAVPDAFALAPGAYGIREPEADAREVRPEEIGLCLVPCLAADETGVRLGRGKGYYDRFVPSLRPGAALLVCRTALIAQKIPAQAHDARFARAVTECGIRRFP